jgi:hypothetical protein
LRIGVGAKRGEDADDERQSDEPTNDNGQHRCLLIGVVLGRRYQNEKSIIKMTLEFKNYNEVSNNSHFHTLKIPH